MKFNKHILLYLVLIVSLFLSTSVSATEMKLCSGDSITIPDEYDSIYNSSVIDIYVNNICEIQIIDGNKLSYEEKLEIANSKDNFKNCRNVTIGDKTVLECNYGDKYGVPLYGYYVDRSDKTVRFIVGTFPSQKWDITDVHNPIHRIVETL